MKNYLTLIITLLSLSLLFSCGDTLQTPKMDDSQDDSQESSSDEEDSLVFDGKEEMQIGADGEQHYYPKSQTIDVDYVGLALLDDPIDGAPVDDGEEPADDPGTDDPSSDDGKDAKKCGDWVGDQAKITKITGSKQDISFEPNSVLAIFVAGNQNQVSISLSVNKDEAAQAEPEVVGGEEAGVDGGEEEQSEEVVEADPVPQFDGICLIMAGNQAKVSIDIEGFAVGHFAMIGRGNQPQVDLSMDERATVKATTIDIRGNGGSLMIDKEGDYECPEATLMGNKTTVTCN